MVETTTKNYGWVKPEIQHSPATWGGFCNNNFDAIDALVFANQQGVSPVGAISMFAGATPPANWLLCDGAVYQNSSIPLLAPILANQYNAGTAAVAGTSSAVPNLNAKLPLGANASNPVGQTGGTFSYTISIANMPAHAHTINVANPQHYHTIPGWAHTHTAYSDVHTHYVYQDAHAHTVANSPHSHNIVTGGHGHNIHTGGHSHGLDHQVATSAGGGQVAPQVGGWLITNVRTDTAGDLGGYCDSAGNLGGYTDAQYANVGNTDNRQPGVYADNRQPAVHVSTDVANIPNTDWQTTAITATATAQGGGAPMSIVPSYVAVSFIIRYQ